MWVASSPLPSPTSSAFGWNRLPSRPARISYCEYFSRAATSAAASNCSASRGADGGDTAAAPLVVGILLERDRRPRRVESEERLAGIAHGRVEAEQRSVAGGGREIL